MQRISPEAFIEVCKIYEKKTGPTAYWAVLQYLAAQYEKPVKSEELQEHIQEFQYNTPVRDVRKHTKLTDIVRVSRERLAELRYNSSYEYPWLVTLLPYDYYALMRLGEKSGVFFNTIHCDLRHYFPYRKPLAPSFKEKLLEFVTYSSQLQQIFKPDSHSVETVLLKLPLEPMEYEFMKKFLAHVGFPEMPFFKLANALYPQAQPWKEDDKIPPGIMIKLKDLKDGLNKNLFPYGLEIQRQSKKGFVLKMRK